MTTATKARPKSALAELEPLEAAWAERAEETRERGRELKQKLDARQELLTQRQHRIHREPGLVDHHGNPLSPGNDVAKIDKKIGDLGDVVDLAAQVEHLKRLEARAKEDVDRHKAEHYTELCEELHAPAEADRDAVHAAIRSTLETLETYLATQSRSVSLTEPIQGIDGRHVPGINEASELRRTLEAVVLPVPVPGDWRVA